MDDDLAVVAVEFEQHAPVADAQWLLGTVDELAKLGAIRVGDDVLECAEHAPSDRRIESPEVAAGGRG